MTGGPEFLKGVRVLEKCGGGRGRVLEKTGP